MCGSTIPNFKVTDVRNPFSPVQRTLISVGYFPSTAPIRRTVAKKN